MEKNLLILERSVSEATFQKTESGEYILEGIFSEIGKKNKNNRIYDEAEFIPHVEELAKKVKDRKILGELDHPKQFEVSLKNVSHVIEEISYDKETKQVRGKIKLLDTDAGKQAKALVDAQVPIHISSRAAGVVESDNHVKVKRLFTYDLVADPGFENAQLNRVNESFGLSNDDNIQLYEVEKTEDQLQIISDTEESNTTQINIQTKDNNTMNETKDESFVSLGDLENFSNYIKEQFNNVKAEIEKLNEVTENKKTDDLISYVESIASEVNNVSEKINGMDENVDNLIAYSNYTTRNLEDVKNYTESIAEATDNSIEYTKTVVDEINSNIDEQNKVNESVEYLKSHNDYIVENMESIANFSDYLKENIENLGNYTESIVSDINENFNSINEVTVNESVEEVIEEVIETENNIETTELPVVENNDGWKSNLDEKLSNLLESAKKQKAVEEDQNLHFLHFLNESKRKEFNTLDESIKGDLITAFKYNKYFGTRDVETIWESVITPETPTLNWLENAPTKNKESFDKLDESKKEEIKLQASVLNLDSQYKIDHFWSTRDLRSTKANLITESNNENTEESVNESSDYVELVKAGLSRRFKTNKF